MKKKRKIAFPLSMKMGLFLIASALTLSLLLSMMTYYFYKGKMFDKYEMFAENIAGTAASQINPDRIRHYLDTLEKDEEYEKTYKILCDIRENSGIEYLYVVKPETDEVWYVLDTDPSDGAIPLGHHEPYYEGAFSENADKMVRGEEIDPIISNEKYGWLMSVYYPMFTSSKEPAGYVGVDILMTDVMDDLRKFTEQMVILGILVTAAVSILLIYFARKTIAEPIRRVADAAEELVKAEQSKTSNETRIFKNLTVRSRDEVGALYDSLTQMEQDINAYIRDLLTVTADKERITTELALATRIQADMLPNIYPAFPERREFDIYGTMEPARAVGGDFYDFLLVDDDHLCMVMADVSGKGVPAALFMMATMILLDNNAMLGKSPAEILTSANRSICSNNREEMFVTVWLGILEISTGKLTAANAGHEYPILMNPGGEFEIVKDRHGFVIGGLDSVKYKEYELQLEPGSRLFLYTDGIPEATNSANEMYGLDRMLAVLNENREACLEELLSNVSDSVRDFRKEAEQFDDLTMLCMEYRGKEAGTRVYEMEVEASDANLESVMTFIEEKLDEINCPDTVKAQIAVAAEEIFVNIAHYAYAPGKGNALVRVGLTDEPSSVEISFTDHGIPYDPLAHEDPDITLSAEERPIGGLGIFITKKVMDQVSYVYENGCNSLTMKKNLT
ncbi:MAG: SpoIIE family protein phosphatase [Lachnospiraceae bacterium]|nr:SpoIIE family protein phosphatase [Lachnospiraceae bacterium]